MLLPLPVCVCVCVGDTERRPSPGWGAGLVLSWLASGTRERLFSVWHWLAACVQTSPLGSRTMGLSSLPSAVPLFPPMERHREQEHGYPGTWGLLWACQGRQQWDTVLEECEWP